MFVWAEKKQSTSYLTLNLRCHATSGPLGNGVFVGASAPAKPPAVSHHRIIMLTMEEAMKQSTMRFAAGEIVKGTIIEVRPKEVMVDIGYKSEGVIPANEFE